MDKKIEKIRVGVALALGWPIQSVACSHTIIRSAVIPYLSHLNFFNLPVRVSVAKTYVISTLLVYKK